MNFTESKDFEISSASLKDVRIFAREVFDKLSVHQEQKDELVERIERFIQNPETILPDNCVQSVKQFDVLEKVKQIYSVYSNMVNR